MKKITLCSMFVLFTGFLAAQSLRIDSTFGTNGLIITNMDDSYGNPYGSNIALLPNGEVVTIGLIIDSTDLPAVHKFGNDGVLDSSFTQVFSNLSDASLGLSSQLDGKLLVTGIGTASVPYQGAIYRLNTDGNVDKTFATDGSASLLMETSDNIIPMELSTGKIVVFGDESIANAGLSVFAARLHSNGTIDTTFGESGYFRFGLPDQYLLMSAALEQPDGKLILAGMAHWKLFMVRIQPDGTRDFSFGTDGYLIDPMPNGGEAYGLALQSDGKILVCGYGKPSYLPIVARYQPDGSRDTTFGDHGVIFYTDIPDYTEGIGIEVLPNGKILTGISSFYGENFYLTQLLPSGARDTTFGVNGVYEYVNNDFRARAMRLNANMLAVSGREESSNNKILLLRFLLDLNVETLNPNTPDEPSLLIYPNPIAGQFNLKFGLSHSEGLSVLLYDLSSKLVQSFVRDQSFEAGEYELNLFCPENLPAGSYILSLEVAGKKMTSVQVIKR